MSPVKKRALISTATAAALLTAQFVAGPAAFAAETPNVPETTTTETTTDTPADPMAALEALAAEEDAASDTTPTAAEEETPNADSENTAHNAEAAPAAPVNAEATAAETSDPATNTDSTPAPAPAKTKAWIDLGFANWNFKDSFREYVGIEHEERYGMGLVDGRLSWYPKMDQKFDLEHPTTVRFGGEVEWTKYDGILHVRLFNPTLDFEKKELRVDAYTKGTLAGGGELTVKQETLLKMDDLTWENRNGYILVHSLKPRITELSQRIFGFYKDEIGAPFVATLETRELGPNKAPQPSLHELFPKEFPSGKKQLSDPAEALRDVVIADKVLRECILAERDIDNMDTPVTNKMLDQIQSLKCIRKATPESQVTSLEGLQHAKNLTSLNLNYNSIEDLSPLATMTQLKELQLEDNKVRSLAPLAELRKLTSLNVTGNKLTSLNGMENMANLEYLQADNNRISDITGLPDGAEELRQLSLSNNRINSLAELESLKWLRQVYVDHNFITSLAGLDKIRGVEKLKINNNYITDPSALSVWGDRDHVISMYVAQNSFTDWSVIDNAKRKIRDWPEAGEEANATNPIPLEEAQAKAAAIDAADPAPQPHTPGTQPHDGDQAQSTPDKPQALTADLHWGVRESFIKYLTTPFVGGNWELTGGAHDQFIFPLAPGQKITRDELTKAQFTGKVHFHGHHGLLDLSIEQPAIDKTPAGWKLTALVASKPFDPKTFVLPGAGFRSVGTTNTSPTPAAERVILADLSAPRISTTGDITTYNFDTVELTEAGGKAFGEFYRVGDRIMAPLSVTIRTADTSDNAQSGDNNQSGNTNDNAATTPSTPTPGTTMPGNTNTGHATHTDGQAKPATPAGKTQPSAPAKTVKECKVDPNKMRVTSGALSWGVRSSFTSYIRGNIAKGGWNLNGVNWDGNAFNFPVSGGTYNTATATGTIYYSGSVHFHGHNGILDLTMSNPAVEINGNSGALYLSVRGSDTSGKKFELGRVHFANISFNGISAGNGALSFDGAAVTLTGTGAQAFAGFYNAGEALDAMSSNTSIVPATACDPVTGELIEYNAFGENIATSGSGLARTGAIDAGTLAALSMSILMLGTLAARRRYAH